MPMQIEVVKKPKSTVIIKGSLSGEEFNAYIEKVTKHFVEEAELPGFRKGKAPERMVVEKIGEAKILEEAANAALAKIYPPLLKEHAIEAIGRPEIRITKLARGNPFEFEADIAVLPEITLADYKRIAANKNAKPKEEITVSDEELHKTIDWLRKSRTKKEHVEPAAHADEPDAASKKQDPPAGGLPDLTDEFAQSVGAFKTVEDLKNAIRENMKFEKDQKAHDKRRAELLEAVSEASTLEIPDILIASEKEKMTAELKGSIEQMGMQWDTYLTHIKKTESDLKNEWSKDAQKRVKSALILREIAKQESIEPSDDELNAWTYQYMAQMDESQKKNIDLERVKDYAYGVMRNQKVFEFLEQLTA